MILTRTKPRYLGPFNNDERSHSKERNTMNDTIYMQSPASTYVEFNNKPCFYRLTCPVTKLTNSTECIDHYYSYRDIIYLRHIHRANLPPIKSHEYKEQIYREEEEKYVNQTKQIQICKICRKKFHSEQQYQNHLASKKHSKMMVTKFNLVSKDPMNIEKMIETDSDVESVYSNRWFKDLKNPVEHNGCLFCNHRNKSVRCNLKHMMEKHSFFIPDFNYCIDQRGLLIYLGLKIFSEYKCIWCNDSGKILRSAEAARMHMIDKSHCKMLYNKEIQHEYMKFYDYSSSCPDTNNYVDTDPPVLSDEEEDDKLMEEPRVPDLSYYRDLKLEFDRKSLANIFSAPSLADIILKNQVPDTELSGCNGYSRLSKVSRYHACMFFYKQYNELLSEYLSHEDILEQLRKLKGKLKYKTIEPSEPVTDWVDVEVRPNEPVTNWFDVEVRPSEPVTDLDDVEVRPSEPVTDLDDVEVRPSEPVTNWFDGELRLSEPVTDWVDVEVCPSEPVTNWFDVEIRPTSAFRKVMRTVRYLRRF